jgi:hypothetical protein
MHNKDTDDNLDDQRFGDFLSKIIAFIWTYAVINPGVNALRTPVYAEMVNIVNNKSVDFVDFKFDASKIKIAFENYAFNNGRPITKSMLTWWAFTDNEQKLPTIETIFEIEHIYSRNRQKNDKALNNTKNMESLGNKSLLEKRINIRASDYRFSDKIKYYQGYTNSKGQKKDNTQINELIMLSKNHTDFTEKDIEGRNRQMLERFISFLNENNLIKIV